MIEMYADDWHEGGQDDPNEVNLVRIANEGDFVTKGQVVFEITERNITPQGGEIIVQYAAPGDGYIQYVGQSHVFPKEKVATVRPPYRAIWEGCKPDPKEPARQYSDAEIRATAQEVFDNTPPRAKRFLLENCLHPSIEPYFMALAKKMLS